MLSASSGNTPQPSTGSLTTEAAIRTRVEVPVRTTGGSWRTAELISFDGLADGREHIAVVFTAASSVPLVRVHSECLTGDVFGSARCDCGAQLSEGVDLFAETGGSLLYLRQEGRGIGLYNKLDAYRLQDQGLDTFAANRELNFSDDMRDHRVAAQMLNALGVPRIRLRTNNPDKVAQLENTEFPWRRPFPRASTGTPATRTTCGSRPSWAGTPSDFWESPYDSASWTHQRNRRLA